MEKENGRAVAVFGKKGTIVSFYRQGGVASLFVRLETKSAGRLSPPSLGAAALRSNCCLVTYLIAVAFVFVLYHSLEGHIINIKQEEVAVHN